MQTYSPSSSTITPIFRGLLLLSVLSTTYLYTYPVFLGCAFPGPSSHLDSRSESDPSSGGPLGLGWGGLKRRVVGLGLGLGIPFSSSGLPPSEAPFRLLVLGDPQLEGDSSLPSSKDGGFASLRELARGFRRGSLSWELIRCAVRDLLLSDVPRVFNSYRKRLDLLGNDYYLAHIYRTVHRFTKPTHVAVLGDLLGSQWISDAEFERRGWRYWNRVFKHGQVVDDEVTGTVRREPLGGDQSWGTRIINIAGNHDIGYAGDITVERLERFERVFGRANWEIRFTAPARSGEDITATTDDRSQSNTPELRIVVLNSLNLDTPALSPQLQADTYEFINDIIGSSHPVEDRSTLTLLLTHLPLHKAAGLCTDGPYFDFYPEGRGGGLKEQNHLSEAAAKGLLEGIFGLSGTLDGPGEGLGRNGVILTGHDHNGCDVYHQLPKGQFAASQSWEARLWDETGSFQNKSLPGKREITVRSMMGEFGGNAGLFSAWFDDSIGEWRSAYVSCMLGTQHQWWAVHVMDSLVFALFLALMLRKAMSVRQSGLWTRANTGKGL